MIEDILITHRTELTAIRHDLHTHPEMLFEEVRTAPSWRASLHGLASRWRRDIAKTGVVGTLSNGTSAAGPSASAPTWTRCRYTRQTNLPYASKYPGKMHACGHDGHTTMLLGLARYLAESRNFDGTVHLIFQPSEEDEGGALRMIEDGLFKRFPCDAVFALHNIPGEEPGQIIVRPGPITAAVDIVGITVRGRWWPRCRPAEGDRSDRRRVQPGDGAAVRGIAQHRSADPAVITVGSINGWLDGDRHSRRGEAAGRCTNLHATGARTDPQAHRGSGQGAGAVLRLRGRRPDRRRQLELSGGSQHRPPRPPWFATSPSRWGRTLPRSTCAVPSCSRRTLPTCRNWCRRATSASAMAAARCSTTSATISMMTLLVKGPAFWARLVEKALPQS